MSRSCAIAGADATEKSDAVYFGTGREPLMMQHDMPCEESCMPLLAVFICLQQDLFADVVHAARPEPGSPHANKPTGCKPVRPNVAKTIKVRIV